MHPFASLTAPAEGVGIHWFGQSSYALRHPDGTVLLTDPYFPHDRPAETYIHAAPPLDEADLRTDFVLLTHNHGDHTCLETLGRIVAAHEGVTIIGPPESMDAVRVLAMASHRRVTVTAGDTVTAGPVTVHVVWAKPLEGVAEDGIAPSDCQHLGFVVDTGRVRVYVSGDPINTFAEHDTMVSPVRALQPDIGLLTNHPTEGEFPFFAGSVRMAQRIGLKTAVPAHYDCFVSRDYDPQAWASGFPGDGPTPLIIPYNTSVIYTPPGAIPAPESGS